MTNIPKALVRAPETPTSPRSARVLFLFSFDDAEQENRVTIQTFSKDHTVTEAVTDRLRKSYNAHDAVEELLTLVTMADRSWSICMGHAKQADCDCTRCKLNDAAAKVRNILDGKRHPADTEADFDERKAAAERLKKNDYGSIKKGG